MDILDDMGVSKLSAKVYKKKKKSEQLLAPKDFYIFLQFDRSPFDIIIIIIIAYT